MVLNTIMFKKCSKFIIKVLAISLFSTMYVNTNISAATVELSTRVGPCIMTAINHIADNFRIKLNSPYGQPGDVDDFVDEMRNLSERSNIQSVKIEFFYKDPQHISYIKYLFEEVIIPRWRENGKDLSVEFSYEGKQNSRHGHIKGKRHK